MLTHGLCMTAENFEYLGRPNDGKAVRLLNPANEEYEVVRTTLLPGLLKTLNHNKSMSKKTGEKRQSDVRPTKYPSKRRHHHRRRRRHHHHHPPTTTTTTTTTTNHHHH